MSNQRAESALPPQGAFLHAILVFLADHPEGAARAVIHDTVPILLQLSEAQRTERLPNMPQLRYRHRTGWGLSMLKAAGYVESPARSIWKITDRGRDLLGRHPTGFDNETGRQLARETHSLALRGGGAEPRIVAADLDEARDSTQIQQSPEERIDAAIREMRTTVAAELLERISQAPPAFFEVLVLDLLRALGYGSHSEDFQHVGASGDGGIDGIISLDKLGFEKVFVQAKRWKGSVGRPDIQAFFGALAGRRAKKGVFITTSTFTKDALSFGEQVSEAVVLIDGSRLTQLMIDHGVAVSHYRVVHLPRVDGDYFEST
ncbi:MAG: restriction endonuclease [Polyangiaceae bacterium]|nr:restriction endonuclease [Polyangiaceae bacterium]